VTTPEFSSANGKLLTGVSASNSVFGWISVPQPRRAPWHLTAVIPVQTELVGGSVRWPDRTACCAVVVVRHSGTAESHWQPCLRLFAGAVSFQSGPFEVASRLCR
jgi:hypothetical protein